MKEKANFMRLLYETFMFIQNERETGVKKPISKIYVVM